MGQMSFEEFAASAARDAQPRSEWSSALCALWLDRRGEWDAAHRCVQDEMSGDGAWVHAYLHRKEGDQGNAEYWYRRAGKPAVPASASLDDEWASLVRALLPA